MQRLISDVVSHTHIVASAFLTHYKYMRYGYLDSMRVPFAEEAVRAFREAAKEERASFDGQEIKRQKRQSQQEKLGSTNKQTRYVLATILLAIKGDRTNVPLPFGVIRQRDMARALSRIAADAKVEDCLIASEVMTAPSVHSFSTEGGTVQNRTLYESEVLKAFPELVQLT